MTDSRAESTIAVSFVIPARNEELVLGQTIERIQQAIRETGILAEIVVVDDGSTDRTAQIAENQGAQVVPVRIHNIAGVRNAGAARARGALLIFLDADTLLPTPTLRRILEEVKRGAVGGGATVRFDEFPGWLAHVLARLFTIYWQRVRGWAAGCCVFATREAFLQVGGFDPHYYAAEEMVISRSLAGVGRFVVVKEPVITSARKIRMYSLGQLIRIALPVLLGGKKRLQRPEGLEILYDAPREESLPGRNSKSG